MRKILFRKHADSYAATALRYGNGDMERIVPKFPAVFRLYKHREYVCCRMGETLQRRGEPGDSVSICHYGESLTELDLAISPDSAMTSKSPFHYRPTARGIARRE